jgi:hypothetical protein
MALRTAKLGALLAFLALVASACAPMFGSGSTITVTPLGGLAIVSWSAASPDTGQTLASYSIDVNGNTVATVGAPATSCVLTGLPSGTAVDISVTATDTTGAWSGNFSGPLASSGRVTTTYTSLASTGGGPTPGCVSPTDSDGDRLPDAVETGTGVFLDAAHTGSDPHRADTDGDGIADGDEVLGSTGGLALPQMGTKPTKKDILVETDWFDDNAEPSTCGAHSHRPTPGAIAKVTTAFAGSPVTNPDGTTGIHFITDYGQGGAFTGGNLIADADGVISGGVNGADYTADKAANFAANRKGYMHYVLMPHRYNTNSTSSGQAEINGDDLVVSLYCFGSDQNVANTIMHELGHNLGLRHGGNVDTNFKPNYNSVMNYQFQFPGIDTNCNGAGDGVLDYSHGTRAALNENALSEAAGICNGVAIDWNGNHLLDAGTVAVDINNGDGLFQVLTDFNDWSALNFTGISDTNGGASLIGPELVTEQPVPPSAEHG